jgi:glycosyltransferase involved in cell wall biosynthesis
MTAERSPHLLYVAWGYPPGRGGGVYRALATPNAFARAGWTVTVLTVERETFLHTTGGDPELEGAIDDRITVVRVPFNMPAYQVDLTAWSRIRARFPELWAFWRNWRDRKIFPEQIYGPWRHVIEQAALTIHRESPVDLVLATANPHVAFTAAYAVHREAQVPFVLDYRDAWQLDVFTGRRLTTPGGPVATWESQLIASAIEIWFVNEPIRRWHQALYPEHADRMQVVANGFDAELAGFSSDVRTSDSEKLVFGYVGTMSAQVPLEALLDGWRLARQRDPLLARSELQFYGHLGHAGAPHERWVALFDERASDAVTYCGPVSKTHLNAVYRQFDALVLMLGTGRYVTSGKVYEYCATGLPVVSVHDPGNAATDVLVAHPASAATRDLSPESIADSLLAGAALARAQTASSRAEAQVWAQQFERAQQLEPRIAALTTLAGHVP